MNISKEAIEAAAEAMSGRRFIEHEPDCGEHAELSEPARTHYARAALEAAAPLLMAQTLREAADDAFKDKNTQGLARAVIGNWLRMKAAKIEEGL